MGQDLQRTTVSKEYVEGILSSMTDCLAILRSDGTIEKVNQSLCTLTGYAEDELVERPIAQLLPDGAQASYMASIKTLVTEGTAFSVDGFYVKKDGQSVPVAIAAAAMQGPGPGQARVVCMAQNISERVASEERLHYRIRLEGLISSISSEFISYSPAQLEEGIDQALGRLGEFAGVDRSFVVLYSADGMTMSNTNEWCTAGTVSLKSQLQKVPADHYPWWQQTLAQDDIIVIPRVADLCAEAAATQVALQEQNICSLVALPMRSEGALIGVLGFASGTKELAWSEPIISLLRIVGEIFTYAVVRRQGEQERLALEEQVRHSQKLESLGVLTGGIAHDFNNLLGSILGNAELTRQELGPDSPVCSRVEEIELAGARAAELVNQMLAYSGRGKLTIEPIDISALVSEMDSLMNVSISRKVVLERRLGSGLPPIHGDATQIRQVAMNLITNAADAIGDARGTITLTTRLIEVDNAYLATTYLSQSLPVGQYIELVVTDTGCGMNRETQARLFDPFYSTKFTGRGLGLSSVLGIIKGHEGAIQVKSELGVGSTFTVIFPVAATVGLSADEDTKAPDSSWRGQGRVLMVEEDAAIRTMVRGMLDKLGFEVIVAEDGGAGVGGAGSRQRRSTWCFWT